MQLAKDKDKKFLCQLKVLRTILNATSHPSKTILRRYIQIWNDYCKKDYKGTEQVWLTKEDHPAFANQKEAFINKTVIYVVNALQLSKNDNVLECGCGTGELAGGWHHM